MSLALANPENNSSIPPADLAEETRVAIEYYNWTIWISRSVGREAMQRETLIVSTDAGIVVVTHWDGITLANNQKFSVGDDGIVMEHPREDGFGPAYPADHDSVYHLVDSYVGNVMLMEVIPLPLPSETVASLSDGPAV